MYKSISWNWKNFTTNFISTRYFMSFMSCGFPAESFTFNYQYVQNEIVLKYLVRENWFGLDCANTRNFSIANVPCQFCQNFSIQINMPVVPKIDVHINLKCYIRHFKSVIEFPFPRRCIVFSVKAKDLYQSNQILKWCVPKKILLSTSNEQKLRLKLTGWKNKMLYYICHI